MMAVYHAAQVTQIHLPRLGGAVKFQPKMNFYHGIINEHLHYRRPLKAIGN